MPRRLPRSFFYLLLFFLILLVLGKGGFLRSLRRFLEKEAVIPLKEEVYNWRRFFKKDLSSCVLQSEKEVAELKVALQQLTEENREQRKLLSSPLPKNWQFLTVKVIGSQGESLIINAGREDGVAVGMMVISGKTLIGKVAKVSEKMSDVRLPSFFEEKLVVKIVGKETLVLKGKGLLIGRGEGGMKVEQIFASEEVVKGDLVITSVEGGDLLVGEIEEVVETKGDIFKTAQVKRLFNPEELETVFLIRGKI